MLDDVVTSFDVGHRRRLIRLLKEEFRGWQVVLLTHESFWFELIKRELGPDGWLLKEVDWDPENGVRVRPSPKDIRELIGVKRAQGLPVGNDVRKLMERLLKEVCESLEVKVPFRYNDRNEERMVGEFLSELRGTMNRKCASLKDHSTFARLEASNVVGTTDSHDRPEAISSGDIDVALQDIEEFEALFRCQKCQTLVARERYIPAEKRLTCRCAARSLDWKD